MNGSAPASSSSTSPRTSPAEPRRLLAAAPAGVLAGIAAKAADESGQAWAADLGSYPAAWVLAVAALGRWAPSARAAAARACVFFAVMSLAYYAWAALVLGFGWNRLLVAWLLLSVTVVPAVAVAAQWATRRPGPLPGALLAGAAGIVLAGGAVLADAGAHPVQAVADVVAAAVLVAVLPRHGRTRLWAPALLLPATWLPAGAWPFWPRCSADRARSASVGEAAAGGVLLGQPAQRQQDGLQQNGVDHHEADGVGHRAGRHLGHVLLPDPAGGLGVAVQQRLGRRGASRVQRLKGTGEREQGGGVRGHPPPPASHEGPGRVEVGRDGGVHPGQRPVGRTQGLVHRGRRGVDRGQHGARPGDREAARAEEGTDQPEPFDVLLAVPRAGRTGQLAGREQSLAQVVLHGRDRHAAPAGQFGDLHATHLDIG